MSAENNTPVFAQTPKHFSCVVPGAVGNINTDAPTGTVLLMKAGPRGAVITRLSAIPRTTVTATGLVLFTSEDAGVTKRLKDSELMPTQAVSAGAKISKTIFADYSEARPLRLGPNEELHAGSQTAWAGGIIFNAECSHF